MEINVSRRPLALEQNFSGKAKLTLPTKLVCVIRL